MKILLLDNYDSFTYNIVELLRALEVSDFSIYKNNEMDANDASEFDKIIFSPGPATPMESGNMMNIISALASYKSMLGICLGHQAIAQSFGAQLVNLETPYHGWQTEIEFDKEHKIFSKIEKEKIKVGLYHSWVVSDVNFPSCLQITSLSPEKNVMSLKHIQYDIHGVQFHPESYMTEYGKLIIENFLR